MSIGYKPVLPTGLVGTRNEMDSSLSEKISKNYALRLGVVTDIIEIEDDRNISKLCPEYDVMTIGQGNTTQYKNCMAIDQLGGVADYFNAKRRKPKDSKKVKTKGSLKGQNGSIVLLLCIDGSSDQGIVLGAIAHPDRKTGQLKKDLGHHMEGEFNGINWKIDKDGALTVTFKSATDNDGKPQDTKAGGTTIKMEKDGSIEAADGNKEKIRIDKTKKTIDITAEKDISVTTDASVNVTAKKDINSKATADMLMDAGGTIMAKSGLAFNIQAEGAFELKAADVKVTSDSMVNVKGTQIQLSAPTILVGDGGTPAVTLSTLFLGIGNHGAVVISTAIGPFSSSVFIGS